MSGAGVKDPTRTSATRPRRPAHGRAPTAGASAGDSESCDGLASQGAASQGAVGSESQRATAARRRST